MKEPVCFLSFISKKLVVIITLMFGIFLVSCQTSPPKQPTLTPSGPEITVYPGKKEVIHASSQDATNFQWSLQGDGKISSEEGADIIYTAPESGGGMAILTVVAYKSKKNSPPNSLKINIASFDSVQLSALAIPAGWMTGGSAPPNRYFSLESNTTNCRIGPSCLRITYRTGGVWGGIFWWPPQCGDSGTPQAWENVKSGTCSINLLETTNFKEIIRLNFWARGARGGERIEFKIGASDIYPIPSKSIKVTLTRDWENYSIDLGNANLTKAVGLFAWIASDLENPNGAVFYLDNIQFVGVK